MSDQVLVDRWAAMTSAEQTNTFFSVAGILAGCLPCFTVFLLCTTTYPADLHNLILLLSLFLSGLLQQC